MYYSYIWKYVIQKRKKTKAKKIKQKLYTLNFKLVLEIKLWLVLVYNTAMTYAVLSWYLHYKMIQELYSVKIC